MGALLTLLKTDGAETTSDIFVDFQNAQPIPEEQALFESAQNPLRDAALMLQKLKQYTGCGDQIRKAISTPNKDTEAEAWQVVNPAVGQLKEFYEFSGVMETCFNKLMQQLCTTQTSADVTAVKLNLERYQATAHLLARLLTFSLDFDDLKMSNPSIQNDFSYYRRTLSRMKMAGGGGGSGDAAGARSLLESAVVKDELANRMSLFYAYPTPMMKTLVDGMDDLTKAVPAENITSCLSILVRICHSAIADSRVTEEGQIYFCLRVMVACIILYDHVHPKGAFCKESELHLKNHIKLIQAHAGSKQETLLNALRYTTKHLNDESASKSVRNLLALQ